MTKSKDAVHKSQLVEERTEPKRNESNRASAYKSIAPDRLAKAHSSSSPSTPHVFMDPLYSTSGLMSWFHKENALNSIVSFIKTTLLTA